MKKVAIIDSGSGGVNVLVSLIKECPSCNYLLLIDDKNLPYGEKSIEELQKIAVDLVNYVNSIFAPEIIVIGCNTLTSVAIDLLRKSFLKIYFIGSEPAIYPALKEFNRKEILILATDVTIENCTILYDYKEICYPPKGLPKIIDDNLFERENIQSYLENMVDDIPNCKDIKGIVLGCTHFEGIKKELSAVFQNPSFFTTSEGIARRLKTICGEGNAYQVQIMTTREDNSNVKFYSYFKSLLH